MQNRRIGPIVARATFVGLFAVAIGAFASPASSTSSTLTPDAALARLTEGNRRFVGNASTHPRQTADRRTEVAAGHWWNAAFPISAGSGFDGVETGRA